ncbi:MAG: HPr family phosphocarrier protein [Polyangiales bacterium]
MSDPVVIEATFEVLNERGLHARPVTRIAQTASRYRCEVSLARDGQQANAKSVMGMLMLCCHRGASVTVRAQGDDAREAVDAIGALFADRFGEDP